MRRSVALPPALAAAALLGCGGAEVREDDVVPGDPDAPPSMVVLPSLDVPRDELTDRMRFGWTLAEESFQHAMPPAPPSGETTDYQGWAEGDLRDWLERKQHTVDSARRELDAAAEESHRQRIMAGAIVGLMYEDVALALRDIPTPAALQTDMEIADIFREILEAQASPFLEHARRAYRACALNAEGGPETLAHWGRFCAARKLELPEPRP
jgi:hypothetical protein